MSKTNYRNSGNVVELGLWDDMARNLNKNEYDSMEKPVIIAVGAKFLSTEHITHMLSLQIQIKCAGTFSKRPYLMGQLQLSSPSSLQMPML
ncbi:hypothetical protein Tco_1052252 [Tanacetum coccineum]